MSRKGVLSRRCLLKAAAAVGAVSLLPACAPVTPATGSEQAVAVATVAEVAPTAATAKQVVIEFWESASPESSTGLSMKSSVEAFTAENPDIRVDIIYKPTSGQTQMSEALLTAIAAGVPPATAYFDRFIVTAWAAENALTDLSDLADAAGIAEDQYFAAAWEEVTGWKDRL